jgi:hypothetical protein
MEVWHKMRHLCNFQRVCARNQSKIYKKQCTLDIIDSLEGKAKKIPLNSPKRERRDEGG